MFEIQDNILIKYNGNEKIVVIPTEVEIIFSNAFSDCDKVEKIIGNNVKGFYFNSKFITPKNLLNIYNLTQKAEVEIMRNGNAKMIFLTLAINIGKLIRNTQNK